MFKDGESRSAIGGALTRFRYSIVAEFVRILTRVPAVEMFKDGKSRSAIGGTLTSFRYWGNKRRNCQQPQVPIDFGLLSSSLVLGH